MKLSARIGETIVYRGNDSYIANVRAILAPLNSDFERVLQSYNWLGLLNPSEASAIRLPVDITVTDHRSPRDQELLLLSEEFAFLSLRVHLEPDRSN